MVQWVEEGIFPESLKELFENPNSYGNKKYRKISLASMFPCLTGTFTSFTNNDVRLGKHTLTMGTTNSIIQVYSKQQGIENF